MFVVSALFFWVGALYMAATEVVPDRGGGYTEGIVGQPQYINPILSPANMADEDLVHTVYDGLFGYDTEGRITERIAERYTRSEDGKTYTVTLRSGVKWHDGQEVTAHDVVFTANAIKEQAYRSPLRQNWLGVDVEAQDDRTVIFSLKKPYFGFLDHLTVGILPKHIWETISPDRFALADANLSPVGSGPYRFFDYQKDSSGNILSYSLRAFPEYFQGEPNITKLTFNFYPDEESMIEAYERKEIMGMSPLTQVKEVSFAERKDTSVHSFHIPRVYGVFFNTSKSVPLAYAEVRDALTKSVDRDAIVREVLGGQGVPATLPFLPFMEGNPDIPNTPYDLDAANRLLDENGWNRGEDGIRGKNGVALEFELVAPDLPELVRTADMLRESWQKIGVRMNPRFLPLPELNQDVIRPRAYDALLYGEKTSVNPDFYSFWHSSEREGAGLNLAGFNNTEADEILFKLREESGSDRRRELLGSLLAILGDKDPAVFLYSPDVSYVMADEIKGVNISVANNASYRLSDLRNRYIETKRVWRR